MRFTTVAEEKDISACQTICVGKNFGKYVLQKELGRGGMGIVFLAHDPALDRQVALKIMLTKNQETVDRFLREARSAAKLNHPNIIHVYDVGQVDENLYFTMDFVDGVSLADIIQTSCLEPARIAEIIRDIALALQYAHDNKVIHRDIKPLNILFDKQDRVYITDFGLAKELLDIRDALTMTGMIVGTPEYMSPEQANGDRNKLGHYTDIFSLGATLYYCLTKWPPFRGDKISDLLDKVIYQDVDPPSRLCKNIPPDLEAICTKAMEKDPAYRYQSAKLMADDLDRYLKGESILARPVGTATRLWRKAKRHKAETAAFTSAIIIIILAVAGFLIYSVETRTRIASYRQEAQDAFQAGNFEAARDISNKLLALSPDEPTVRLILARSQSALNEQKEKNAQGMARAEATILKNTKQDELRNKAQTVLDRISLATGPQEKLRIAQEALAIDPDFGAAYQSMGYAYKDLKDYDTAFDYFSKAIAKNPQLAYSYFERAYILAHIRKKPVEASADLDKALELDPNNYMAYLAKGIRASVHQETDKALEYFNVAIELNPDSAMAYNNRGNCYYEKAMLDRAIQDYTKAIELNNDYAGAFHNRGDAYRDKGLTDRAIADYTQAIELKTPEPEPYYDRARLYARQEKFTEAIADGQAFLKLAPTNALANDTRELIEEWEKAAAQHESPKKRLSLDAGTTAPGK